MKSHIYTHSNTNTHISVSQASPSMSPKPVHVFAPSQTVLLEAGREQRRGLSVGAEDQVWKTLIYTITEGFYR